MYIQCSACNKIYAVDDSFEHKKVNCKCGHSFIAIRKDEAQLTKRCPACGELILAIAQKCRYCGEYLDSKNNVIKKADRVTYTLLGLFLGGIGVHNFFAGNKEKWAGVGHIAILIIAFFYCCIADEFPVVAVLFLCLVNCVWILGEIIRGPE